MFCLIFIQLDGMVFLLYKLSYSSANTKIFFHQHIFAFSNICTVRYFLVFFFGKSLGQATYFDKPYIFLFYFCNFTICNCIRLFRSSHRDYSTSQKYSATCFFFLHCRCPSPGVVFSGKYLWGIFMLCWFGSPRSDFLQELSSSRMIFRGVLLRLLSDILRNTSWWLILIFDFEGSFCFVAALFKKL